MKLNKFFGASVLAMGMTLGFTSCGSDDFVEQAQPAVETQNTISTQQKADYINNSFSGFSKRFGNVKNPINKKLTATWEDLPQIGGPVGEGVENLQDMLKQFADILAGQATTDELYAVVKLCNIYGEYAYNAETQTWKVVSYENKDVLKLTYRVGENDYATTITYNERTPFTSELFATEVTVFGKTFVVKTTVNVPTEVTLVQTENEVPVLEAHYKANVSGSDFNLAHDPFTVSTGVKVAEGSLESLIEIDGGIKAITVNVYGESVEGRGELLAEISAVPSETANYDVTALIAATEYTPAAKLTTSVSNVSEVADAISQLYRTGDQANAEMWAYVVEKNVAPINVAFLIDDEWVEVTSITFELGTTAAGGFCLNPVFADVDEELLQRLITEGVSEDVMYIINIIITIISSSIEPLA